MFTQQYIFLAYTTSSHKTEIICEIKSQYHQSKQLRDILQNNGGLRVFQCYSHLFLSQRLMYIYKPEVFLSFPSQAVHNFCHFALKFPQILVCKFLSKGVLTQSQRSFAGGRPSKTQSWERGNCGGQSSAGRRFSLSGSELGLSILRQWRQQATNETPLNRWTGKVLQSLNYLFSFANMCALHSNVQAFDFPLSLANTMFPNYQLIGNFSSTTWRNDVYKYQSSPRQQYNLSETWQALGMLFSVNLYCQVSVTAMFLCS